MQTPKNPAETGKKFLEYLLATGPESNLLYSVGMAAAMAAQEAREVLHPDPLGTELWPDGLPNPIPKKYREDAAVEAVKRVRFPTIYKYPCPEGWSVNDEDARKIVAAVRAADAEKAGAKP
jgi:hypothetical protein